MSKTLMDDFSEFLAKYSDFDAFLVINRNTESLRESEAQFVMGLIADLKHAQSELDIDLEDAIDTLEARL